MGCVHMKQQLQVVCERTDIVARFIFVLLTLCTNTANCDVGEPHVGKALGSKRSFYFKLQLYEYVDL